MKILVTGATGFVGGHLSARLLRDGHELILQGARSVPAGGPASRGVRTGPLESFNDWEGLLAGVDLVVNLAARAQVVDESLPDSEAAAVGANVTAVQKLTEAMFEYGVTRLVHFSTIKARSEEGVYGRTKLAGEKVVQEWSRRTDGRSIIIRPPMIYGPQGAENLEKLVKLIKRGLPLPIASVRNRRSILAIENCVDAIAQVVERGLPEGAGIYEVCDNGEISLPEIVRALAEGVGIPARMLPFPPILMRGALSLVSPKVAESLFGDLTLDNSSFSAQFGWTPLLSTTEGLQRMGKALAA